jgi:D-glycero-beta-D-manno-heptose-7-phosphate kinase
VTKTIDIVSDQFAKCRVIVVGDLIADQFLNGTISRVSREAPVFILKHENTETVPGGAANAAANIAALGGRAILIGVVGSDLNGEHLCRELNKLNVDTERIVTDRAAKTTTKLRVLAGQSYAARQQVIRIDYESSPLNSEVVKQRLLENLVAAAPDSDAIIISDYSYGAVFPEIFQMAREVAETRKIPLVVDSRYALTDYPNATTATPNREEVENIIGHDFSTDECEDLRSRLGYRSLLMTNGNKGIVLIEEDKAPQLIDAVGPKEPVDVTGAGDTVIAAYTLALACGTSFVDAAHIANHAGGIVVMKKGTATVTSDELFGSLRTNVPLMSQQAK